MKLTSIEELEAHLESVQDPPSTLLDSSHVPSDSEIEWAKKELCELEELCAPLRKSLSCYFLDKSITAIPSIRLHYLVECYQSIISPSRRLPNEILQEIFRIYLPETQEVPVHPSATLPYGFPAYLPMAPRLRLLLVCQKWRNVLLTTPSFWSSFEIQYKLRKYVIKLDIDPNAVRYLERAMSYSGTAPLHMSLEAPSIRQFEESQLTVEQMRKLADIVYSSASRWESLQLSSYYIPFLKHVRSLPPVLPRLQKLSVGLVSRDENSMLKELPEAPSLVNLHLFGSADEATLKDLVTRRYPRLTHLAHECPGFTFIPTTFDYIRPLEHLTHLHLRFIVSPSADAPLNPETLDLPLLQELCVDNTITGLDRVLQIFRCPSLTSLRINVITIYGLQEVTWIALRQRITEFVNTSGCTAIKHLALTDFHPSHLPYILPSFSSVEFLEIYSFCYVSDQTVDDIDSTFRHLRLGGGPSKRRTSSPVLPQLKKFSFNYADNDIYRHSRNHHDKLDPMKRLDIWSLAGMCESRFLTQEERKKYICGAKMASLEELQLNLADHGELTEEELECLFGLRSTAKELGSDFRITFTWGKPAFWKIKAGGLLSW